MSQAPMHQFQPIRSNRMNAEHQWFETRPDLFLREFSPPRAVFFGILAIAGIVFCIIVYRDIDGMIESMTRDRRRDGYAILGGFVLPPLLILLGGFGLLKLSRRWRLRDRGLLRTLISKSLPGDTNVAQLFTYLRSQAYDPAQFLRALKSIPDRSGQPVVLLGQATSEGNGIVIFVYRRLNVPKPYRRGEWVIEEDPIVLLDDEAFDALKLIHAPEAQPRQ